MKAVAAIALACTLTGCASSHDLASGGRNLLGGGHRESELAPGVYQILVKTNWAPWVNESGARSAWRDRARAACGSDRFREVDVQESSYDDVPGIGMMRYIVTTREGYAVCESAGLSDDAVNRLIHPL